MDLSKIKIDSAKIARGDWVGELPFSGMEGLRLKVRGLSSAVYRDTLAKRGRAVPRSSRNRDGSMPIAIADRVTGEALAEAVLLDWEGLYDGGDFAVPYDKEFALKLLTDPDFAAFREAVIYSASIVAEDDRAAEDDTLGKLRAAVRWRLEWGELADALRDNFERAKKPIPSHLFPPDLDDDGAALLEAFWELSSDRQYGNAIGQIPFASIDRWAARYGIDDPDDFALFRRAIRAMDAELIGFVNKK